VTIQIQTIEYAHDDAIFEGCLVWDDEIATPLPGVVVYHAWGGLGAFEQSRATELAKLGYAAFCPDLYGKGIRGDNPDDNLKLMQPLLDDRPLLQSRVAHGVEIARDQDAVDKSRVAAIGYCFGGLCVLDLARIGSDVRGVVSFHGLFQPPGNTEGNSIHAKVLALHGWEDPAVPPEGVVALATELTEAGADWQIHGYGHTLHAFTKPDAQIPNPGSQYSETADRRSWQSMTNFLTEIL
jgi:dienelactone hydrolase